jgi:hypothetical protein
LRLIKYSLLGLWAAVFLQILLKISNTLLLDRLTTTVRLTRGVNSHNLTKLHNGGETSTCENWEERLSIKKQALQRRAENE